MSFFQWSGPALGIPTTTYTLTSSSSPSPITIIGDEGNLPIVIYPPPIEIPFTTLYTVVDGRSYMVMDDTIILNATDGFGLALVTGIPSPATTPLTVTKYIYIEDLFTTTSTTTNDTVVIVILPTNTGGSDNTNTLPQTTSTSGTITYTWSEQQIDSLATIPTTTTITTTEVDDKTTSTLVMPVNTGGFYWSPVPIPDIPLPTIPFPDLAPIPTLHCFRLFDIFTIDYPPNGDNEDSSGKSTKTVRYTSGKESPTCSPSTAKSCGTLCTSNCYPSSTSTSMTTTSSTTCSSESTVTDYWVSCNSASCITTSTATATGCNVTASTTTMGIYCALSTSYNI
ncbi:hypothetical protein N7493_000901 [Penicillium malachiteum]|uniref:Uncharacterized protein n=1 Tax=Penicillium malachiteum TaxID=1324776 RepID=A0AAD6HYD5_9EURO|nr:hypothetical protein N7493_000901 [Penicillium malachiteum]